MKRDKHFYELCENYSALSMFVDDGHCSTPEATKKLKEHLVNCDDCLLAYAILKKDQASII